MSSVVFASAFVVLVLGMFLALGGAAYAANESPSSANDEYDSQVVDVTPDDDTEPTVVKDATVVSDTADTADTGETAETDVTAQTLPNTGLSLLGAVVLGGGLVALGIAMRRRERRDNI